MTDEEYEALLDVIRPRLSGEFLATLLEVAKIYGNSGDWPAVEDFVRDCYQIAGVEAPETIMPY